MTRQTIPGALGLLLLSVTALQAAGGSALTLAKVGGQPTVDGKLDDPVWQQAIQVTDFLPPDGKRRAKAATTALLCYDEQALYVAFLCDEPHTSRLVARAKEEDGPVSRDDSVGLLLVPGSKHGEYYKFSLNSRNTRYDQRTWGTPMTADTAWDGEWRSATAVTKDRAWTAELAIPWVNFTPDLGEEPWSLSLWRNRRAGSAEVSTYFPAGGALRGTGRPAPLAAPDVDFSSLARVALVAAVLRPPGDAPEQPRRSYFVEGWITSPRATLVKVEDRPGQGEPSRAEGTESFRLPNGHGFFTVSLDTGPAQSPDPPTLRLSAYDKESGKQIYTNVLTREMYANFFTAYLDRSYYTTEKEARAIFGVHLPSATSLTVRAEIAINGGRVVARESRIRDPKRTVLAFSLAAVPVGSHPVLFKLLDPARKVLASYAVSLRKEKPAPSGVREVKVDRERTVALVDGEPFFPIAIYGVPPEAMKEFAAAGFNSVVKWNLSGTQLKRARATSEAAGRQVVTEYLDACQEAGLKVIEWPTAYGAGYVQTELPFWISKFSPGWRRFLDDPLPFVIESTRRHPAVVAYYGPDEPEGHAAVKAACREYADAVTRLDPYHPNFFLCAGWNLAEWPEIVEIGGLDFYAIGSGSPLVSVYDAARYNSLKMRKCRIPLWWAPLCETYSGSTNHLTGPMQQAQGYLAVIGGSNGVMWWVWPPRYQENWEALKKVAGEFRALTPVLVEPTPDQKIVYLPREVQDTVKVLVKRHAGKTYLITTNAHPNPVTATFSLPRDCEGEASVWFESRRLPMKDGAFTDSYAGNERHVYEIPAAWRDDGTLTLRVTMKEPAPVEEPAATASAGGPNLIPDPGFEGDDGWEIEPMDTPYAAGTGGFEESERRSGKRCLLLRVAATRPPLASSERRGAALAIGPEVLLEPNTHYVFGGQAKAAGRSGCTLYLQSRDAQGRRRRWGPTINVRDRAGWARYSVDCTTGDQPLTVVPTCRVDGEGSAWFDDLFLCRSGEAAPKKGANLLRNAGFEKDDVPFWPEHWETFTTIMAGMIGPTSRFWHPDDQVAFEGKRSLRLFQPEPWTEARIGLGGNMNAVQMRLPCEGGQPYTLSAYVKGDRPGAKVRFMVGYDSLQDFEVGTEWQRRVFTVTPYKESTTSGFILMSLRSAGTVWIDAVQFEKGATATEYRPGE
ncbi:MAG: hypothetical protein HY321_20720 [Armatimonadetes bacterium]|nr:hypothetical protein [Armatimonadota bacterium]